MCPAYITYLGACAGKSYCLNIITIITKVNDLFVENQNLIIDFFLSHHQSFLFREIKICLLF